MIAGGSPRPGALLGAAGVNLAEIQSRVAGTCPAGQFFTGINQDGSVSCMTAAAAGGGDITAVFTGAGLTGGSASGDTTLGVGFGGTGTANTVARSDHDHGTASSTGVGRSALANGIRFDWNTGLGASTLASLTSGNHNIAAGYAALAATTTGIGNVGLGSNALGFNTQGGRDVGVGYQTLLLNTTGGSNVAIGYEAGVNLTTGSNNIYIGTEVGPSSGGESNTIRIGDWRQSRTFLAGVRGVTTAANNAVPVVVDSNGQLGTVSFSGRTKHDIADLPWSVGAPLQQLRPVQFRYNQAFADGSQPIQYIAEQVQEVMPNW